MTLRPRLLRPCLYAVLLVAAVLVTMVPVRPASPAAAGTTVRSLLSKLTVTPEAGNNTYSRALFRHWTDADGDCQNTRVEVLVAESRGVPTYTTSARCVVALGSWDSYYDGATWTRPADLDVDHLVPLKEAWGSGARLWSPTSRTRYAERSRLSSLLAGSCGSRMTAVPTRAL